MVTELPDIHFGHILSEMPDWRSGLTDESSDNDEELAITPEDVVKVLGFDPLREYVEDSDFDESEHPRDEEGKFSSKGSVFHGTSSSASESILKEGIKSGKIGEVWASKSFYKSARFGKIAMDMADSDECAIVVVDGKAFEGELGQNFKYNSPSYEVMSEGDISPDFIRRIDIYSRDQIAKFLSKGYKEDVELPVPIRSLKTKDSNHFYVSFAIKDDITQDLDPASINWGGLDIRIENPVGSVRPGTSKDGKPWQTTMKNAYGWINGVKGVDKDHLDCFLGPDSNSQDVYVIDQIEPTTDEFDEHKVILGCHSEDEAEELYRSNYQEGWQGLGSIHHLDMDEFKQLIGDMS